jgi:hypothetical protein
MHLQLFKIPGGYLVCPAGKALPDNWAASLSAPDMLFRSSALRAQGFIEEQVRINGSVILDHEVANMMFEDYPDWLNRKF